MKCSVRSCAPASESARRTSRNFSLASWSRFSPKCRTPSRWRSRTSEAGKYFVTTTRVTASGSRPASAQPRAMRSWTAARLSRSCSSRGCASPVTPRPRGARPRPRSGRSDRRAGRSRGHHSRACSPEPIAPRRRPQPAVRPLRRRRRLPGSRSMSAPQTPEPSGRQRGPCRQAPRSSARRPTAPPSRRRRSHRGRASRSRHARRCPLTMPGRPAWTAPTTPARTSCSRTGTQSATSTARARSVARVTIPSTAGASPAQGPSTSTTSVPCTWFMKTSRSRDRSTSCARASRLASTSAAASPTWPPRFRPANAPPPRPADRPVKAISTASAGRSWSSVSMVVRQ